MKKIISVFLIISMLLSCVVFAVPASAKASADNIAYVEALFFENAPTIDGYITDAEWGEKTFSITVWNCATTDDTSPWYEFFYNRYSPTNRDDYGAFSYNVWLRWDLNKFYVGVKVYDPDIHSLKNGTTNAWNGDALLMRVDKHGANAATNGYDFSVTAERRKPWSTNNVPDFIFGYVDIAGGFSEAWENVSNKGMTSYSRNPFGVAECVVAPAGSDYSNDTMAGITTYEIAIPWAYIYNGEYESLEYKQYAAGRDTATKGPRGALGKELGVSMAVMNDGANATAGWDAFLAWGSGICEAHQTEGALSASGSNSVTLVETRAAQSSNYTKYDPSSLLDAEFSQENIDNPGIIYDYLNGDTNKDNKVPYDELYTLTYDDESDLSVWGASEYGGKLGYAGAEHGNVLDYTDMTADTFQSYIDTRDGMIEYLYPTSYTFEFDIMYTGVEEMAEGYGSELYNWFGGASGYAYQCGYFFNDNAFKVVNTHDLNEVLSTYSYDLKKDTWYNWKFQFDNESCTARLWVDDLSTETDNIVSGTLGEPGYTGRWGTLVVNSNWRYFYYSTEKAQEFGTLLLFRQMNVKTAYDNVKIYNFATPIETFIPDPAPVPEYDILPLDTPVEVSVTENNPDSYFQFIPEETGIYSFYSKGYEDTYGYVFDENFGHIGENDDSRGQNFNILCQLEAGKKYILGSRLYGYGAGTYTVQIEKIDIANIDFYDVTVIEDFDSGVDYAYNEITGEYDLEWKIFYYSVSGAITMKDGTVEYFEDSYYNGMNVGISDDQSYYSQWTAGNTYSATANLFGIEKAINVSVLENPVAAIHVDDVVIIENTSGYNDTYWDENDNPIEWYRYEYYPTFTIEFLDGSTASASHGNPVYINGNEYYLSIYDGQSCFEPWGVGKHTVGAHLAGFKTTFTVEIIQSPVVAIHVDDVSMMVGTSGYYTTDWDENDNLVKWFQYEYYPSYTVELSDGSTVSSSYGEPVDIFGEEYYLSIYDDQSCSSPWGVGEHTANAYLAGFETTFTVEITESPIASISIESISIPEGSYSHEYNSHYPDGSVITYLHYHDFPVTCTVKFKDGTIKTLEKNESLEYDGSYYYLSLDDDQSYENQWGIGTHTVRASLLDAETEFEVEITKSPIVAVYVDDISIVEKTEGYHETSYDDYGNPVEWYRYELYSGQIGFTVVLEDNSTIHVPYYKNSVTIDGISYDFFVWSDQSCTNQWDVGAHTAYAAIGGHEIPFNVNITESPVVGVVFKDITLYEGINSSVYGYEYNPETGEYDIPYYRYEYTPECVVLLKDGSVIYSENGGVTYGGETYWIDWSDTQYEEEWGIGTHKASVSVLGYDSTVNVTVEECPYTGIEISGTTDLWITLYKKDGTSERVKALGYGGEILETTGPTLCVSLFCDEGHDYSKNLKITSGKLESNILNGNLWFNALFAGDGYEYNIDVYRMHYNEHKSRGLLISELNSFDGKITKDNIDAVTTVAVWNYDDEPWSDRKDIVIVDGVTYYYMDIDFARDCIERMFGITNVDFTISELYDPANPDKVKVLYQMAGGRGGAVCDLRYENGKWIYDGFYTPQTTIIMNDALQILTFEIKTGDGKSYGEIVSLEINSLPVKTTYKVGNSFDPRGLSLKVKYSDGTEEILFADFTTSGFDSSSAGEKTITVTCGSLTTSFVVTVEKGILGDVNGDGTVNAVDSNLLKRFIVGTLNTDQAELFVCSDINGDGTVNALDSNLLKRIIAGISIKSE